MKQDFKKGAASMYVVVIAALLFSVLTVSFIRIIVSESLRTANSELAQSAYDSALAGVEDAKTALMKYYNSCKDKTTPTSAPMNETNNGCDHINYYIENALNDSLTISGDDEECSTISNALRRNNESTSTDEVLLEQSTGAGSNTEQAYTCVTIADKLDDYSATLGDGDVTLRVVPLLSTGSAKDVKKIKIGWYDSENISYSNANRTLNSNSDPSSFRFYDITQTPPVISVQLIQTSDNFSLSEFEDSTNGSNPKTNRGTVFLAPVPGNNLTAIDRINKATGLPCASNNSDSNCQNAFVVSNNHEQTNYPILVSCKESSTAVYDADDNYACAASITLPDPKGGDRIDGTFFLVVSLPYGGPKTNFSIKMYDSSDNLLQFDGVQTMVDSTGRANDMFSRVEARLEMTDIYFPYAEFALQLSGGDGGGLNKNFYVTKNCWGNNCSDSAVINNP
ncbi:hypothetical protein IJG21_01600 [Candidatus Saccharibacteria bacterium]|nr:hypothetical protein [Candidatus Saccharibacteria bacterium]